MNFVPTLIWVGAIILIIAFVLIIIAKQYRKVGPNEVLIIAGGRKKTWAAAPSSSPSWRPSTACPWTSSP